MSFLACCVPGCSSRFPDGPPLHRFPNPDKDPQRFRSWVMNIGGDNRHVTSYRGGGSSGCRLGGTGLYGVADPNRTWEFQKPAAQDVMCLCQCAIVNRRTRLNKYMEENQNNIEDIDVNSPDFYEKLQNEIEFDMARMKKGVEVVMNLRLEAAEIEVETAALFHNELWYDLLEAMNDVGDENEETQENSPASNIHIDVEHNTEAMEAKTK